jgi:hypothetical protein
MPDTHNPNAWREHAPSGSERENRGFAQGRRPNQAEHAGHDRSAPLPRDHGEPPNPAQTHPPTASESANHRDAAARTKTTQPETTRPTKKGLFQAIAEAQGGSPVLITVAPDDAGRIRVTVVAVPHVETRGANGKGSEGESTVPLPFDPVTAVAEPAEFDAAEGGIVDLLSQAQAHRSSLAAAMEEAERAHEVAVAVEKKKTEDARKRSKKASAEGPLFIDDPAKKD